MKIFKTEEVNYGDKNAFDGKKDCPSCDNRVDRFYAIAETKEQALEEFKGVEEGKGKGLCNYCITDIMADGDYQVFNDRDVGELLVAVNLKDDIKQALTNTKHSLDDGNIASMNSRLKYIVEEYIRNDIDFEQLANNMGNLNLSFHIKGINEEGTLALYDSDSLADGEVRVSLEIEDEHRRLCRANHNQEQAEPVLDIILDGKNQEVVNIQGWNKTANESFEIDLRTKELKEINHFLYIKAEEIAKLISNEYNWADEQFITNVLKEKTIFF